MRKKHFISSFSFPREKEAIIEAADTIAKRERLSLSTLITNLLENYVKTHAGGNPSFELTKWVEQPEFVGDPAIRETNEKWDKYLAQCDQNDLAQLMGTFQKRLEQTKTHWKNKRLR